MKQRAAWWWVDRWRKSTAYTDMTLTEQGAYRNLLDELWLRDGVLPADDRVLAKISGDALEWPSVRDKVLQRFVLTPEGYRNHTHDEVASWPAAQAAKGKIRAGLATRSGGKFTSPPPAGRPAEHQPTDQPEHQPGNQPPSPSPSPSPYSVSGRTADHASGHENPPQTAATPADATAKALSVLGAPCGHPAIVGRPVKPGRLVVCPDCGEEFRGPATDGGPKRNPFVQADGRDKWEREALRLTGEIGGLTGEDGPEIFARAAQYEGAAPGRQKCNPANLTDDRLLNTVLDLRATMKAEQAKRRSPSEASGSGVDVSAAPELAAEFLAWQWQQPPGETRGQALVRWLEVKGIPFGKPLQVAVSQHVLRLTAESATA